MAIQVWRKASGQGSHVLVEEDSGVFQVLEESDGLTIALFRFDAADTAVECARAYCADEVLEIRAENIIR